MAGIPDEILEEIKARTELSELIASYGIQVRRNGMNTMACCPFHREKTPSFNITDSKGVYHCFGCGASGDVFKFVQQYEGLTFMEAAEKLAKNCGVEIEKKRDPAAGMRARLYALHAELSQFFKRCLKSEQVVEAEAAREYLRGRKLDGETVEKFCIGYVPQSAKVLMQWAAKYKFTFEEMAAAGVLLPPRNPYGQPYNRFGGRLAFTICDKTGRPVAFSARTLEAGSVARKYVNSPETPVFKKSHVLFAFDKAAGHIVKAPRREAIVCEGQIDVIRCHANGFECAVASQGTAFTEEHVKMLGKCADSVVLVFDADGAGRKAAVKTGGLFLAAEKPVRVASLPAGEDPDSFLRDRGAEAFRERLEAAEPIMEFTVRVMMEAEEHPGTVDALKRVSGTVLEMIAGCPSSVMRAAMLNEAAAMLKIPAAALQEDLRMVMERKASRPAYRRKEEPARREVRETRGEARAEVWGGAPRAEARAEARKVEAKAEPAAGWDDAAREADEFCDFGEEGEFDGGDAGVPEELDAGAPQNNPPPAHEKALCEFLMVHEGEEEVAGMLERLLPCETLRHEFTRGFVRAWLAGAATGEDEIAKFHRGLSGQEARWMSRILTFEEQMMSQELKPEQILQTLIRRVWTEELHRRRGMLPAAGTEETHVQQLQLTMAARAVESRSWKQASAMIEKLAKQSSRQ